MTTRAIAIFSLGLAAAVLASYGALYRWNMRTPLSVTLSAAAARTFCHYRDPSGAPYWSATPKNDTQGRAYLPVYDNAEPSFDPPKTLSLPALSPLNLGQRGEGKILYYRNPMGLPDTSPVPKKDSMGMDYIAVYEGDEPNDGNTVKISLDRVQRSGVRTEKVEPRVIVQPVRGVGTVAIDESRQTIVT